MSSNVRPESMQRITNFELANAFIEEQIAEVRAQVGNKNVLLALSGGVDSSVVAALLIKAIGKQLTCVHVNHGLMRKGESEDVVKIFGQEMDANLVYIDATADGKTEDDTFGITGIQWVEFIGFLHASGLNYIGVGESGNYEVVVYNDVNQAKTADLVDKLAQMVASDYAWFRYRIESTPVINVNTGRTLMGIISTNSLPGLCDYDVEFGVLPYPMYDEAQKDVGYRHLQWGGYLCVPSYSSNPVMIGETVEMLAFFSDDVNVAFYEKLLGKQVADMPLDRQMLELVWDTICPEFGQAYTEATGSWLYMLPELTWVNATQNLASYVKSKETSSNKKIKKFFAEIDKINK